MVKAESKPPLKVVSMTTVKEPVTMKTVKIEMLKSALGADGGIIVKQYVKGETYDVCESLAKTFSDMGVAKKKGIKAALAKKPEPKENKAIEPEENKSKKESK